MTLSDLERQLDAKGPYPFNQSINQSIKGICIKRPLQNWTAAMDISTVIKYDKIKYNELQYAVVADKYELKTQLTLSIDGHSTPP